MLPFIFAEYEKEGSEAWWFFIIHKIVHNAPYDAPVAINIAQERQKWLQWWQENKNNYK